MTGRGARTVVSLALIAALSSGCSTAYLEIPIETPIQPKLDVRPFSRVYVAGFVSGRHRGRRRQPRNRAAAAQPAAQQGPLRVIDADALDLADVAGVDPDPAASGAAGAPPPQPAADAALTDETAVRRYEKVFADTEYWKKIGEEFQQPLIVTGTVLFRPQSAQRLRAARARDLRLAGPPPRASPSAPTWSARASSCGRASSSSTAAPARRSTPRPSARRFSTTPTRRTPALSSFFELMDRLLPSFLNTLSAQKVRGSRVLLK